MADNEFAARKSEGAGAVEDKRWGRWMQTMKKNIISKNIVCETCNAVCQRVCYHKTNFSATDIRCLSRKYVRFVPLFVCSNKPLKPTSRKTSRTAVWDKPPRASARRAQAEWSGLAACGSTGAGVAEAAATGAARFDLGGIGSLRVDGRARGVEGHKSADASSLNRNGL